MNFNVNIHTKLLATILGCAIVRHSKCQFHFQIRQVNIKLGVDLVF